MPAASDHSVSSESELARIRAELDHQRSLAAGYSWELAKLRSVQDERDRANAEREEMAASLAPLVAQRDALLTENAALRARSEELGHEVNALRLGSEELERIRSSRVWTVTAPVRRVSGKIRSVMRGRS